MKIVLVLVVLVGFRPGFYEWQDRDGAWQSPVEVGEDGVLQFDPCGEITFTPDGNRQIRRVAEGDSMSCDCYDREEGP
jgi:hypothetical protein